MSVHTDGYFPGSGHKLHIPAQGLTVYPGHTLYTLYHRIPGICPEAITYFPLSASELTENQAGLVE